MNICFYESSSGFGGSAGALANMANNLDKNNYSIKVLISEYGPQFQRIKNATFIRLKHYDEPQRLSYASFIIYFFKNIVPETIKICFLIKKHNISLIHINTSIRAGIPAIIAAWVTGIPSVSHTRNSRRMLKREILFTNLIDKVIFINHQALLNHVGILPKERMQVVYDGIELEDTPFINKGTLRKEFSLGVKPIICAIGRIVEGKGQKEFVLAAKEVLEKYPQAKFVIVGAAKGGDVAYYEEVKTLVSKYNLDDSIIFSGWRKDIENILIDIDMLVLPSTTFPEGLPNCIIEAMAFKKPIISTNIPGPNEIVVDGKTGFLVPPGDVRAMANKIAYLLDNVELRNRMGEEGRRRVEEKFNIKETVKKIEKLYKDVLEYRNSRRFKRALSYKLYQAIDLISELFRMFSIYLVVNIHGIKNFDKNIQCSYIGLEEFIEDRIKKAQIKRELITKEEFLLGEIDQDSRLLSFDGKLPFFDNITRESFIPRWGYKLYLVVLKIDGEYLISIKKRFGKDRINCLREILVLMTLASCNVPRLLKVDLTDNSLYMSLVPGITVRDMLALKGAKVKDLDYINARKRGELNNNDVKQLKLDSGRDYIIQIIDKNLLKKIYERVTKINSLGVILEDIKYGNLLIGKDGEPYFIDLHTVSFINRLNNPRSQYLIENQLRKLRYILNSTSNIKNIQC